MQFNPKQREDRVVPYQNPNVTSGFEHTVDTVHGAVAPEEPDKADSILTGNGHAEASEDATVLFERASYSADSEVQALRTRLVALESQILQQEAENRVLNAEMDAIKRAALSDKVVTRDYIDSLQGQLAEFGALKDAYHMLAAQAEDFIAALQVDASQVATLIDIVQASRFWRLKRALQRLRTRISRR